MKKTIIVAAFAVLSLLCSCSGELKFGSKGVDIHFEITDGSIHATKLFASAYPAVDEMFYYWDVAECSELDRISNQHFMELKVDELYVDYLGWRHEKLVQGEPYIAAFQYHSLSYGPTSFYFTELEPEKDYYLYGFCVNPVTKEPIGNLHKVKFTTKPNPSPEYRSEMTFDFEVHGNQVMIVPSVEGQDDYFIWDIIPSNTLEEYHMNIETWALDVVQGFMDSGILRYLMCKGITKEDVAMVPGQEYIIAAGAYDANFEKTVYTKTFLYTGGEDFTVERSHDPMTWYHPVKAF